MKNWNLFIVIALISVNTAFGQQQNQQQNQQQQNQQQQTQSKNKNQKYHVMASHTKEECLNTLNETKTKGNNLLSKLEWGCKGGDHTAYGFLEGSDEAAIKRMMPTAMQNKVKINMVDRFTAEEIEKMHASVK